VATGKSDAVVYIHDVAREAGCSISTVSKVMNGSGSISDETRVRIMEVANRLGYTPQAAARMLKNRRTENVGLIFHQSTDRLFSNPFFSIVIAGVEEVLTESNYNLLLGRGRAGRVDWEFPKFLRERFIDGLLLLGSIHPDVLDRISQTALPFVLMDHPLVNGAPRGDSIQSDGEKGARQAVEHLVSLGHRRIAMLAAEVENPSTLSRNAGYLAALASAGLAPPDGGVVRAPHDEEGGEAAIEVLLRQVGHPDALFCVNDAMAIGAMRALARHGLKVPRDLSVVGFDDIQPSAYQTPPLTTVRVDMKEMGRCGARCLLERLQGVDQPSRHHLMDVELVVRESTIARSV
jgi:DNA-binding LacI/PurR family transcriptional regulator